MAEAWTRRRTCEVDGCKAPASGRFCERHWKQVQRAGAPAELALARMMDAVFALGAVGTDEHSDDEYRAAEKRFLDAFLEAARHRTPVLSKLARRLRRR